MLKIGLSKKIGLIKGSLLCLALAVCGVVIGGPQAAHAATFTVTNTSDSGAGSLRQALADAAANTLEVDTITFNIPGAGPHIIMPSTNLNLGSLSGGINDYVILDGCSQPGSDCSEFPATLQIQIDATNMPTNTGVSGQPIALFYLSSFESQVRGVSITGGGAKNLDAFASFRVAFGGTFGNTSLILESSFIGLRPDGSASGNRRVFTPGSNIRSENFRIGGPNVAQGNVISGNTLGGVIFPNQPFSNNPITINNSIENNYFGLDPTGTVPIPNGGVGISMGNAGTGNIIRNNRIVNQVSHGISLNKSSGVTITENEITGSGGAGIDLVTMQATNPTVITNNTITGSTNDGITIGANISDISRRVTIRQNSIYGNGDLGIDLANNGVTANDTLDPDLGPNTLTNSPVLTKATDGSPYIAGSYDGLPDQTFTIDFYANQTADSSGNGEGQTWIGSTEVTTDATGKAAFGPIVTTDAASNVGIKNATLGGGVLDWVTLDSLPAGWSISATATDVEGNTSEFSNNVTSSGDIDSTVYDVYFQYRVAGSADPFTSTAVQALDFPSSYAQDLTGLLPGTSYEYRLVVLGDEGETLGNLVTFTTLADTDNDGIPNVIEDAAPNSGDANNDGTPDSAQANVGSFVSNVTGSYVSLELDAACQINTVSADPESSNTTQDQDFEYPIGLTSFTADCGTPGFTTPVTYYHFDVTGTYTLRKYNPTTNTYIAIDDATFEQTSIGGASVAKASFEITDGGDLDIDATADGIIIDPAGLAQPIGANITGVDTDGDGLADTGQNNVLYMSLAGLLVAGSLGLIGYKLREVRLVAQNK